MSSMSLAAPKQKQQMNNSTPPFRVGGRGSKQLSKAIEKRSIEKGQARGQPICEPHWAFCFGNHPCFAKIISSPSWGPTSVIIQPMFSSDLDPNLLVPWEGHLWLAKKDKLFPVKMKQEPAGWRVVYTSQLQQLVSQTSSDICTSINSSTHPVSLVAATAKGDNDWDLVSLESSDFDEASSVESLLFPQLGKDHSRNKKSEVVVPATSSSSTVAASSPLISRVAGVPPEQVNTPSTQHELPRLHSSSGTQCIPQHQQQPPLPGVGTRSHFPRAHYTPVISPRQRSISPASLDSPSSKYVPDQTNALHCTPSGGSAAVPMAVKSASACPSAKSISESGNSCPTSVTNTPLTHMSPFSSGSPASFSSCDEDIRGVLEGWETCSDDRTPTLSETHSNSRLGMQYRGIAFESPHVNHVARSIDCSTVSVDSYAVALPDCSCPDFSTATIHDAVSPEDLKVTKSTSCLSNDIPSSCESSRVSGDVFVCTAHLDSAASSPSQCYGNVEFPPISLPGQCSRDTSTSSTEPPPSDISTCDMETCRNELSAPRNEPCTSPPDPCCAKRSPSLTEPCLANGFTSPTEICPVDQSAVLTETCPAERPPSLTDPCLAVWSTSPTKRCPADRPTSITDPCPAERSTSPVEPCLSDGPTSQTETCPAGRPTSRIEMRPVRSMDCSPIVSRASRSASDTNRKPTRSSKRKLNTSNEAPEVSKRPTTKGMKRRRRENSLLERPPARQLPQRSSRNCNYANRDSFFGSWPTRDQAASKGTWRL